MEALDRIGEFKLNSNTEFHLKDTLDSYKEYLNLLSSLKPRDREAFLQILKRAEIVNNQEMELEDPFLVQLGLEKSKNGRKQTSIDVMTDSILGDKPFNLRKIEQLHRLVITGTADDIPRNYKIRDFDTYVSEINNGIEEVSYYAPSPEEIRPYFKKIFKMLNDDSDRKEQDVLFNSILMHFYIAALQPFGNGNTRLARLTEYGSIFKLSREILGSNIKSPALFVSKNYLMTRKMYRDSIKTLVNEPTDENFNRWYEYNLNMIDEQLNYCKFKINKM